MRAIEIDKMLSRIPPNATMKVLGRMVTRTKQGPDYTTPGYKYAIEGARVPYSRADAVRWFQQHMEDE